MILPLGSRKQLKRISLDGSETLRRRYLNDIHQFAAEDLVFLDKSVFNEKTGRRYHTVPFGIEGVDEVFLLRYFSDFLELALRESRCDRFARQQFHTLQMYILRRRTCEILATFGAMRD